MAVKHCLKYIDMSRIGKKPIKIPKEIKTEIKEKELVFENTQGRTLIIPLLKGIKPEMKEDNLLFRSVSDKKQIRSNWGTMRSLASNAVIGLSTGFEKTLEIEGLGYKVSKQDKELVFNLGYSHPIQFEIPEGIEIEVEKNKIIKIKGYDKQLVGETAAKIRKLKKPEPYKGKGIRYQGEIVRRKVGKKAVATM